jgi:hypothetical protein
MKKMVQMGDIQKTDKLLKWMCTLCRRIIQHDTQEKIVKLTKEKQSKKNQP